MRWCVPLNVCGTAVRCTAQKQPQSCFSRLASVLQSASSRYTFKVYRLASGLLDTEDGQEVPETETGPGLESPNSGGGGPRCTPWIQRAFHWGCGKEYDLSEPRLWVCGGCGEARYCDESCQRAHWPAHERPCWEKFVEKGRERVLQGESMEKIRQEYNEWYPASQLWGNP